MEAERRVDQWIFAWCALSQRARRWQSLLDDALGSHDLVAAELLVLWRTGHASPPGISQVELARELNISTAQVSGVVDSLVKRAWLGTVRPAEDRRRLYCSLTVLGQTELANLVARLAPLADRCLCEDAGPIWSPIQEKAA